MPQRPRAEIREKDITGLKYFQNSRPPLHLGSLLLLGYD